MKRKPSKTDKHVGARLRVRREHLKMSQGDLGQKLGGITFQQVQKYEKGDNRMSVSRLHEAAHALQVPVTWFFEGLPASEHVIDNNARAFTDFMTLPYAGDLIEYYASLTNQQRHVLLTVARHMTPQALQDATDLKARKASHNPADHRLSPH